MSHASANKPVTSVFKFSIPCKTYRADGLNRLWLCRSYSPIRGTATVGFPIFSIVLLTMPIIAISPRLASGLCSVGATSYDRGIRLSISQLTVDQEEQNCGIDDIEQQSCCEGKGIEAELVE